MRLKRICAAGFAVSLLAACTSDNDLCSIGQRVSMPDPELRGELIAEMQERGMAYQEEGEQVCYLPEDENNVRGLVIILKQENRDSG